MSDTATVIHTDAARPGPHDVCDRCGARARALAVFRDGAVLMFCRYHDQVHGPSVRRVSTAYTVQLTALPPWGLAYGGGTL